jgi:uncharacterized protein (TIGR03067 family)
MVSRRQWLFPRRACVLAVLAAALALGFAPVPKPKAPPAPTAKGQLMRLQGTWEEVRRSRDGSPLHEVKGGSEVVDGDRLSCVSARGEVTARWSIVLRPSKSPKEIDLCTDKGQVVVRCIYKLEGDTMTVCYRDEAHTTDRPADFTPRKGFNVQVLKRAKKKP